jgi:hypothetical protein
VRVSAAPRWKVGAVHARSLNQAYGRERLALPEPQGFMTKPFLYGTKAFSAYALLHLKEVSLSRHFLIISTGGSHFSVPSESLDEVFYVGYLLQLTQHERSQITLRLVLYKPPCPFNVQALPEDGLKRS